MDLLLVAQSVGRKAEKKADLKVHWTAETKVDLMAELRVGKMVA